MGVSSLSGGIDARDKGVRLGVPLRDVLMGDLDLGGSCIAPRRLLRAVRVSVGSGMVPVRHRGIS